MIFALCPLIDILQGSNSGSSDISRASLLIKHIQCFFFVFFWGGG